MKVKDKRNETWKPLDELIHGDCFEYNNEFYISVGGMCGVNIETGSSTIFDDYVKVKKVVAEVTIYEEYYKDEEYEKLI